MEKGKVSQKTWFTVLFLILFFPVGLYLMWKNKKFNKTARIIITVMFAIFVIANLGNGTNSNSEKTNKENNIEDSNTKEIAEKENEAVAAKTEVQTAETQKTEPEVEDNTIQEQSKTQEAANKEQEQSQSVSDNGQTMEYNGVTYKIIEVDGGDRSGSRQENVAVDVGYGDRAYWAFTNEYGQLVNVIADKIILQDDSTEPVNSDGRYYDDEANVQGTEQEDLDQGHVIADSLGGVSNAYNITPQNSTLNRHGDQAYMEKVIRDAGGCESFIATITYPDTTTQIPSHYHYEYILKGENIVDDFDNINSDEVNKTIDSQLSDSATSTESAAVTNAPANEQEELAKIDVNGNGTVTIKEAKAAGYSMPITSDNWLYKYMIDNDNDGAVGE